MDLRTYQLKGGNPIKGDYVLCIPFYSLRVSFNYTLSAAINIANSFKKPLIIYLPISKRPGIKTLRHFYFFLEGLLEFKKSLQTLGLDIILTLEDPFEGIKRFSRWATAVVSDYPYLKEERAFWNTLSRAISCPIWLVEGNVVVPSRIVSKKAEPFAGTFRQKILKIWREFLTPPSFSILKKGDFST